MIDVMIGLGIPILNITLGMFFHSLHIQEFVTHFVAYVVQIQRYEILGDFGCRIPLINTSLGVLLDPAVRLFISLIGGIYGCKKNIFSFIKILILHS